MSSVLNLSDQGNIKRFRCPSCNNVITTEDVQCRFCNVVIDPTQTPALVAKMEQDIRIAQQKAAADTGGGSSATGWLVFILIYVVGNIILYNSCGVLLIPIPRR